MRVIDQLVCPPPATLILEEAGTFHYCDAEGEDTIATFFVRCPPKPGPDDYASTINSDRQDAANQQTTDMSIQLEAMGCKQIHFKSKQPDPFF